MMHLIVRHKIATTLLTLLIVGGGYFGYTKLKGATNAVRYVTAPVERGSLVASVSGSGQVSVVDQTDIKPKVSGEISAVYIRSEQKVASGALLAHIDASDAARAVRTAETSLETAKLELDKLLQPADELTLFQAETSLVSAQESKKKAEDDLRKAYEDGFNAVANTFLDLPGVMTGLYNILFGTAIAGAGQWNIDYYASTVQDIDVNILRYKNETLQAHQAARSAYDTTFNEYKAASRFSEPGVIEALIDTTYETTRKIAEAIKSANNLVQFYQEKLTERNLKPHALSTTHLSDLSTSTGKTNTYLSNLLSIRRTIQTSKDTIVSANRSITERTLSLAKTKASPDALDIRARKITIQDRETALLTAREALTDHAIRAPFSGVVTKVNIKKGDTVSSGTVITTLITQQKIAKISLNEVDIAKVKVGQKATLTFDAIAALQITGTVIDVDTLGTVTQGVVTYTITIGFDTQDDRIKSGMSLSAAIVTDVKQDVLLVPNSAVKAQGNEYYVEVQGVDSAVPPERVSVEIGLSNDTSTEIISGLQEGDTVVTRTITSATPTPTQQAPSLFGGAGGGNRGGGGGAIRIPRN